VIDDELPETIDVDGMMDERSVRYIGKASRQGSLCIVEVNITATAK